MRSLPGPAAPPRLHQEQDGAARPPLTAFDSAIRRGGQEGYFDWLDHVWSAAGCSHPVRLFGDLATLDTRTGEVVASVATSAMPDGVIYKACGNRRA
ncbi:MAG: plasmid replication initiator protein, partial [Gemmatimonadales bacterium]|nr:plasmid replication initiator protein [Gemmatimonadales bacterium]